jgi:hypothetical protein
MEIELLRELGGLPRGRMGVTYVASTEGALLCRDSDDRPLFLPKDAVRLIRASRWRDEPTPRPVAAAQSSAPAA